MDMIWEGAMLAIGIWIGTLVLGLGLFGALLIWAALVDWIRKA